MCKVIQLVFGYLMFAWYLKLFKEPSHPLSYNSVKNIREGLIVPFYRKPRSEVT